MIFNKKITIFSILCYSILNLFSISYAENFNNTNNELQNDQSMTIQYENNTITTQDTNNKFQNFAEKTAEENNRDNANAILIIEKQEIESLSATSEEAQEIGKNTIISERFIKNKSK